MKKFNNYNAANNKNNNIFEFLYQNMRDVWMRLTEETELIIFIEDVFLGKYKGVADEMVDYMMKISDEQMLMYIREGKRNGYIRTDIEDDILVLFMTGVSLKIKGHLMIRAREAGGDFVSEDFNVIEKELKAMLELIKNGMGAR